MKIAKQLIVLVSMAMNLGIQAQQLPPFTQYMFNTIAINPAYAGSKEVLNVTALYRDQWLGLEGSPTTGTFSMHAPMKNNRVGLGLSYVRDELGFENSNFVYADFAYRLQISDKATLALGLKAGATNYNLENPDINDPSYSGDNDIWNPNFGFGAFLSSDRWYAGVSAPRILNNDLNEDGIESLERITYYAFGGFVIDFPLEMKFKPALMTIFTNGAPATIDFSGSFLFYERLWLGASYRFNAAANIGAFVDYQITKNVRLGYAYDLPTTSIRSISGGSHEVFLIFEPRIRKNQLYKAPGYF